MAQRSNNKRNNSITKVNKIGGGMMMNSSGKGLNLGVGGASFIGNLSTNRA